MRLSLADAVAATYTRHATLRMAARGVDAHEVDAVLTDPQNVFGPDARGRYTYQAGRLAVVVSPAHPRVKIVTVLFRTDTQWSDKDMRERQAS